MSREGSRTTSLMIRRWGWMTAKECFLLDRGRYSSLVLGPVTLVNWVRTGATAGGGNQQCPRLSGSVGCGDDRYLRRSLSGSRPQDTPDDTPGGSARPGDTLAGSISLANPPLHRCAWRLSRLTKGDCWVRTRLNTLVVMWGGCSGHG